MMRLTFLSVLTLVMILFSACTEDINDITVIASDNETLSTFIEAIEQVGLAETLQADGPFTVFAPTNDAFQALFDSDPDWNTLSDIDNTTLRNILLFHIINGNLRAGDVGDDYIPTLASGPSNGPISLQTKATGGITFNGFTMPAATDIEAENGIIHVINEVMLPPNVVNLAVNNSIFSSLVAALTREDLDTDYLDILNGDGPFTVFAPTKDAFQALLDSEADWTTLADIPVATLEAVLNYHVVNGANVLANELNDGQVITTIGGSFEVEFAPGGTQFNTTSGQSAGLFITNIQGTNGVIHVINQVLLP